MASRSAILAIRIIADAAGAKKGLDQTATAAQKFEKGLSTAAKVSTVGLTALAGAAIVAGNKASDLAESTNAAGKVFEDALPKITAFGETSAQSVGLSTRSFQELATSTGGLLTNMGYSVDEAADATLALTQRAADMASVYNVDVDQALSAVNAGLRGESEPLRALNVSISDATIKARAFEMGLYDGTGALDSQARALAVTEEIMAQSKKTAGDFGDTADGLANRQRTLAAEYENAQASLGEALLPAMESAVGIAIELTTWMKNNTDTVKKLTAAAAALAAGIIIANAAMKTYRATMILVNTVQKLYNSNTLRTIGYNVAYRATTVAITAAQKAYTAVQWALNVAMSANPIGIVIALVVALVAAVVIAYKRSTTFRNIVDSLGRVIKGAFVSALNAGRAAVDKITGAIRGAWNWVTNLINKVRELIDKLKSIGGGLLDKLNPFSSAVALPAAGTFTAAGATSSTSTSSAQTVNITVQALDPAGAARVMKRALEGYDLTQGRAPGQALAVSW